MYANLIKIIFTLLTFITTNPDIPQSVKDQSIALVSSTAEMQQTTPVAVIAAPEASTTTESMVLGSQNTPASIESPIIPTVTLEQAEKTTVPVYVDFPCRQVTPSCPRGSTHKKLVMPKVDR